MQDLYPFAHYWHWYWFQSSAVVFICMHHRGKQGGFFYLLQQISPAVLLVRGDGDVQRVCIW